jgi:hypothetical protein
MKSEGEICAYPFKSQYLFSKSLKAFHSAISMRICSKVKMNSRVNLIVSRKLFEFYVVKELQLIFSQMIFTKVETIEYRHLEISHLIYNQKKPAQMLKISNPWEIC